MKGSSAVIDVLNDALTAELTAINQYFIASKMAKNWSYDKLAHEYYEESLGEMKHAEAIIERILMFDGVPNMQRLFTVHVGETIVEQFKLNYEMEKEAVDRYRRAITVCQEEGDPGTRAFFEDILHTEEEHVDEAEGELAQLDQIGEALWLQKWV